MRTCSLLGLSLRMSGSRSMMPSRTLSNLEMCHGCSWSRNFFLKGPATCSIPPAARGGAATSLRTRSAYVAATGGLRLGKRLPPIRLSAPPYFPPIRLSAPALLAADSASFPLEISTP